MRSAAIGIVLAALAIGGCATCSNHQKDKPIMKVNNADFYKDGKFDVEKANAAYFAMMENFGVPVFPAFKEDKGYFWAIDFNRGEFASFGMAGVIYVNEKVESYFGHDIYLLPGQCIAEHSHVKTDMPAKIESWLTRNGCVYAFSEIGEKNIDSFPEVKALLSPETLETLKSYHVEKWDADGRAHKLAKEGSWHFLMGGPDGAIVSEFATYHDGAGLRFANPGVKF